MVKKAAIYDPYLDTLGGGERYCLTVAQILLSRGFSVDLFWSGQSDLVSKAEKRFNLHLNGLNIVPDIFGLVPSKFDCLEEIDQKKMVIKPYHHQKIIKKLRDLTIKYRQCRHYDLFFYLSDGSIPFLFSKKNILHIQVPFKNNQTNFKPIDYLKNKLISTVICNSNFTSGFVPDILKSKTIVLAPPISIDDFTTDSQKENVILSVGRFDNILNAKKQDILIDSFGKLYHSNPNFGWKLILAGGSRLEESENNYLRYLKDIAQNLPIEFFVNPDFKTLKNIYAKSKIYWHAAGFGVDESQHPENVEHFGITPVEAMASSLVPLLVNKGGLKEIVTDSVNGYLWDQPQDLIDKSKFLIDNPSLLTTMSLEALKSSQRFSTRIFEEKFIKII